MTARRSPTRPGAIERARRPAGVREAPRDHRGARRSASATRGRRRVRRGDGATCARRTRRSASSRAANLAGQLEESALRRRAAGRQPERTGSRITSSPYRRIWAGTRRSYRERRAGPVTATRGPVGRSDVRSSGLRSRASSAALPHHHPRARARCRAPASASERRGCSQRRNHDGAEGDRRRAVAHDVGGREAEAQAAGEQMRPSAQKTLSRRRHVPVAARSALDRFPESRRAHPAS